jgi:hypothetical protein
VKESIDYFSSVFAVKIDRLGTNLKAKETKCEKKCPGQNNYQNGAGVTRREIRYSLPEG